MARKPVFSEEEVVNAARTLYLQGKKINGTNLRLEIGSGSPKKLLETYINLLAKGKVEDRNSSQIENLETQLEASLEALAKAEESLDLSLRIKKLLINLFFKSCGHMYSDPLWIAQLGNPYSNLLDTFICDMKELDLTFLSGEVDDLHRFLIKGELRVSTFEDSHVNDEIKELSASLSKERFERRVRGGDLQESDKELELKLMLNKMYQEINEKSLNELLKLNDKDAGSK